MMKKLTKAELEALGRRVKAEIQELADAEQAIMDRENEVFYASMVSKVQAEIAGLSETTQDFLQKSKGSYSDKDRFSEERIRQHFYKRQTRYDLSAFRYGTSTAMDALILSQLEAKSVSDLVASVVALLTAKKED